MISRPNPTTLVARLKKARNAFGLNLREMAAELRITPEWLSKILNGHERPSYNIGLRLDDFLRRGGVNWSDVERDKASRSLGKFGQSATAKALRTEIRLNYCRLLGGAGNDTEQLRRIAKQFQTMLSKPGQSTGAKKKRRSGK